MLLALAACTASEDTTGPDAGEIASRTPSAPAVSEAARTQLDWFLGVLAAGEAGSAEVGDASEVGEDEYEQHFAEVFRDAVPWAEFQQTLAMLRANAPYTLGEVSPAGARGLLTTVTGADGTRLDVNLGVDADGRIDLLSLAPVLDTPPATIPEAADRLAAFGELRLVAATVDGRACRADVDRGATTPAPIGSLFKLYVLGAVADAVAAGRLSWDDQLTITADGKSLPGGELDARPDGSTVPLREAAQLMIEISDNTAADLLLRTVGREAAEAAQAAYGHTNPSLNVPFPTTREVSILKLTGDAALRQAWVDGDADTRRAVLADIAGIDLAALLAERGGAGDGGFGDTPIRPDAIEWFASPMDLCRAMATLLDRAREPGLEPVRDILTANPGSPARPGRWSTVAFKGGSEPGLLAAAWVVESPGGARHAFVASVVDPAAPLEPEQEVIQLMVAARDLLPAS